MTTTNHDLTQLREVSVLTDRDTTAPIVSQTTLNDVAILEAYLDNRGIPRHEQDVPWGCPKQLKLSQRVLLFARAGRQREIDWWSKQTDLARTSSRTEGVLDAVMVLYREGDEDNAIDICQACGVSADDLMRRVVEEAAEEAEEYPESEDWL